MSNSKPIPGTGGDRYIPYAQRTGAESPVYFTRDLSPAGLRKAFSQVGGSCKNIGIGCADGRIGKAMIHTTPGSDDQWDISNEEFMERMTESAKAVADHFGEHICYVNVLRNMSVSCDCEGVAAEPVVTPNIGILASPDILAIDQASVDLVYALKESDRHALVERMESRHGLRQLSYMKELGMGCDRYRLIDLDNGGREITAEEAARDAVPFRAE